MRKQPIPGPLFEEERPGIEATEVRAMSKHRPHDVQLPHQAHEQLAQPPGLAYSDRGGKKAQRCLRAHTCQGCRGSHPSLHMVRAATGINDISIVGKRTL